MIRRLLATPLFFVLISCGNESASTTPTRTAGPQASLPTITPGSLTVLKTFSSGSAPEEPLFEDVATAAGIDFVNPIDNAHPLNRLYISGFASSGVAVGDVDADGLPDLYLTRGPGANRLYRQTAAFQFEDITEQAGVAMADIWSSGAAFADVNGDGHLDLYVCAYDSPNRLFLNDGAGNFQDNASEAGVAVKDASLSAHFQDYDQDGDLDFYLVTNRLYRAGGLPPKEPTHIIDGKPAILPEFERYYKLEQTGQNRFVVTTKGRPDQLFQNDGTGKFTNATESAGITGDHYGLSATWIDYDQDNDLDLYVANDFKDPDRLYQNQGNGTFRDVIQQVVPHTPWFSMGSDAADMNNDGLVDLFVLDMSSTTHYKQKLNMGDMARHASFMDKAEPRQLMRNAYFLNSGMGRFLESAHLSGLASSDWSWAVKLADFDNDSLTDVLITNGMTAELTNADLGRNQSEYVGREEWSYLKDQPRRTEPNMAFRNRDGFQFDKTAKAWGIDHDGMSYAAAWADLDRDGNLDLVVGNLNENVSVYQHRGSANSRLLVSLRGLGKNPYGIGAKVTARTGRRTLTRVLNPATGFMSSNDPIIHFGLGDAAIIDELVITWPTGTIQVLTGVEANRHLLIAEPNQSIKRDELATVSMYIPVEDNNLSVAKHTETTFDDFATQPLLPNKLSQLGPGVSTVDLDGDGDDDAIFGTARGEKPHAHFFHAGQWLVGYFKVGRYDAQCEDMAPLLFDADADGDMDWFAVSGGVEAGQATHLLEDRLYVQQKPDQFVKTTKALPNRPVSGGGAAAADIDRDGDLDLVVTGRVIPGQYPLSPGSAILRNDSKVANEPVFKDATDTMAPGLKTLEMATSALWSDVNNDGWVDLLVTTEWGPVRVFLNRSGVLEDATESAGLADYQGWWNGIAGRDFDNDGDIDYVATNFGHNTKYHPNNEQPSRIYYGTFGETATPQIIEAKVYGQTVLPVRGKSCSQNAMPFVRDKFPTYHAFASATLTEIYSDQALDTAKRFEANTLSTSLLINDGQGKFTVKPLPELAQIAPGFGVVATEVNGDGNADLYLVQNFFTPQRETGKMAGGLSVLLLGDGKGNFKPLWPNESGLVVPGDAKGLATMDFNIDGWVDFVVTNNNAHPQVFLNNYAAQTSNTAVTVSLVGSLGNRKGIGARVTLVSTSGQRQTAEVYAGGSYLSQSSSQLHFGSTEADPADQVEVRWPDGTTSTSSITNDGRLEIEKQDD